MQTSTVSPLVYISVLNWNGYLNTITCLNALRQIDYPNYRIIVVDNASTDGSVEHIRRAFPDQDIVCADSNLGYAHGNKLALDRAVPASADLFWILNNDALVQPDTLSRLVDAYRQHGIALYGSLPVIDNGGWRIDLKTTVLDGDPVIPDTTYESRFTNPHPLRVTKLSGASLLMPLALVARYGFIDLDFFMYSEEEDYILRLAQHGIDSLLVPSSVIFHDHRGAHKHNPRLKPVIIYYQVRNRLTLIRRYRGAFAYTISILKHILFIFAWILLAVKDGKSALAIAAHTFYGIRDSLLNRLGKIYAPEHYL